MRSSVIQNIHRSSVHAAMRTPHIWRVGMRATLGHTSQRRGEYGWWRAPSRFEIEDARKRRIQLIRMAAPPTKGLAATPVITVASARIGYFRLVDAHGRPHGRRYVRLGPVRDSDTWYHRQVFLVADQYGNESWMDGATRVRHVAQQPEDLMSRASRLLTAAHKRSLSESQT